ncbi:MAG: YaaA family protein [Thiovulaceae bacterium]|nr:YaaA family protein [Sulfurimonadaceae bacterium]MCW9027257.1 YaaA family protein [Sulfurimonadaceae bacterium]
MLKILFSPSEGKKSGGDEKPQNLLGASNARDEILKTYNEIVNSKDEDALKNLFGFKKFSDCKPYIVDIFNSPLMDAIERYQGVAYDYLKYQELNDNAKNYIKQNTIIFSNLYGPIYAGDKIANYKVKQGNNIGDIVPDKFYKDRFSYQLDLLLTSDDILDLRAGYYDKFYKPNKEYTTLKFLKEGKVVSHWAKAYRGLVLKAIANANIQNIDDFKKLEINGLSIHEIKTIKNKTEIVYNITQ